MRRYPKEILDLLSAEGFDKRFELYMSKFDSYKEAYEAVEEIIYQWFNVRKYNSYESFRVMRSYRKAKKKKPDTRLKRRL